MKFKIKFYEIKVSDNYNTYIKTPSRMLDFIKDDFDYNEKMVLIGMNIKNKIIVKKDIAIGSYNVVLCTPADIFVPLFVANARSFILVHNHPSDDCNPSSEDVIFTKKINKASELIGLSFLDHIIVSNNDHYSCKKNGIL